MKKNFNKLYYKDIVIKSVRFRSSLVVQWLFQAFTTMGHVQFLVGELRSFKPRYTAHGSPCPPEKRFILLAPLPQSLTVKPIGIADLLYTFREWELIQTGWKRKEQERRRRQLASRTASFSERKRVKREEFHLPESERSLANRIGQDKMGWGLGVCLVA